MFLKCVHTSRDLQVKLQARIPGSHDSNQGNEYISLDISTLRNWDALSLLVGDQVARERTFSKNYVEPAK